MRGPRPPLPSALGALCALGVRRCTLVQPSPWPPASGTARSPNLRRRRPPRLVRPSPRHAGTADAAARPTWPSRRLLFYHLTLATDAAADVARRGHTCWGLCLRRRPPASADYVLALRWPGPGEHRRLGYLHARPASDPITQATVAEPQPCRHWRACGGSHRLRSDGWGRTGASEQPASGTTQRHDRSSGGSSRR